MDRRSLLKLGAGPGTAAARPALGFVPAHNWDRYDWGTAPAVRDRLYQGPFPQYPPEEVLPGSKVVMATTPSRAVVPGYGMGLVTYVTGDFGGNTFRGVDMEKAIEAFAQVPMGQKLYVRPTWRELQKRPGRLDPDPYWKTTLAMAKQYGKRVGFRVQMSDPDIEEPALPDFVLDKVPMVPLRGGEWKRGPRPRTFLEPRYDHPFFQDAFRELNALLAAELDGSPLVEDMDTFKYGFWGEGHTWPFTDHPFPDGETAERTFVRMLDVQLEHWKRPRSSRTRNRTEPRRQLGAARPHHPQPQLGQDRHHLRRERADRGDLEPAALGGGGARGGDVRRLAGVADVSTRASPTPTTSSPTSWTSAPTTGRSGTGTRRRPRTS